jgi:hypothetical protein
VYETAYQSHNLNMYGRRLYGLWRYNGSEIRYTEDNTRYTIADSIIVANAIAESSNI